MRGLSILRIRFKDISRDIKKIIIDYAGDLKICYCYCYSNFDLVLLTHNSEALTMFKLKYGGYFDNF